MGRRMCFVGGGGFIIPYKLFSLIENVNYLKKNMFLEELSILYEQINYII